MAKTLTRVGLALAATFAGASLAHAQDACTIKVARIVPMTGALADVGKDTPWVDDHKLGPINQAGGLSVGAQKCKIDYKIYDSKSTVAGSAEAATQAILQDKVDFLIAQGTPDTTNAPSDICERNHVPCLATDTPVQAWLFGPDGKPKTYAYTYEFFFSVGDLVTNHIGMIKSLPGGFNGHIGYLYPNDADGTVFAQIFGPDLQGAGLDGHGPRPLPAGPARFHLRHQPVQAREGPGRHGRVGAAGHAELSATGGPGQL